MIKIWKQNKITVATIVLLLCLVLVAIAQEFAPSGALTAISIGIGTTVLVLTLIAFLRSKREPKLLPLPQRKTK